ncbi:TPA: DGQHR domain-containing protein [Bacillus cereus]|nr:DGQHR domain-containing protein [Bacillus cereus]
MSNNLISIKNEISGKYFLENILYDIIEYSNVKYNFRGENMKKIRLLKMKQKGHQFYLLSYDPRKIIQLINFPESGQSQENQRPWVENRVKDIAKYVAGFMNLDFSKGEKDKKKAKGILPNCPILNVTGEIKVINEDSESYILLPETDAEYEACSGNIEVLDGQHRLISFNEHYLLPSFKDNEIYEMGYVVFQDLTTTEKKEIFVVANEKQEKVEKNVLRQIMKWLGLLSKEDAILYELIEKLNTESISPIKGRISVGGEKVKNGFKLIQLQKILKGSGTYEKLKGISVEKQLKAISYYLKAWESVYSNMFNNPKHTLGKISGFRYIMYLFPYISEILEKKRIKTSTEEVKKILTILNNTRLNTATFNEANEDRMAFRAETATIALARNHGDFLKKKILDSEQNFNPNDL